MTRDNLETLVERARKVEMTPTELREQRQSFVYGNTHIENDAITREIVAEADRKVETKGDAKMNDITGRPARLADYAPPKHKNGPPAPAIPLPEIHQNDFEGTVREHYAVMAERDALRKEVSDLKTKLAATEAAMLMVEANAIASESRVVSYQAERDKAVAERAKWEALFVSIQAQLEAFIPPTLPIVKEAAAPFEAE